MNWRAPWRRSVNQASHWFERIQSGRIDDKVDKEFVAWMEADMKHVNDYEMRELTWELTEQLRGRATVEKFISDANELVRNAAKGKQQRGNVPAGRAVPWRWAAVMGAATVAAVLLGVFMFLRPTVTEYSTQLGEQRLVSLTDHSTISLNTGSEVRVTYSRSRRQVELLRGEALFSVAHDASRPFEVAALQGIVRAVGTQFAVQLHPMVTEVSVLEGTVLVVANKQPVVPGVSLTAGQAVDYTSRGEVSSVRPANLNRIRGWQAQKIVFEGIPLVAALEEYNRYARTSIVLGNAGLGDRKVHGVFRIGDERGFVQALERALPLRATQTETQIVLLARAEP